MRGQPEDLDATGLSGPLREGWGFRVAAAEYVPEGGGSHHWSVHDETGRHAWVTVDELDRKGYLGATRESAFAGLRAAFDVAATLHEAGLEFVVAPLRAVGGETVRRLDANRAVSVFPLLAGVSGLYGSPLAAGEGAELAGLLARLHEATALVAPFARPAGPLLPERAGLEDALRSLGEPWVGGPLAEPARALLADHAPEVRRLLDAFDLLAARVGGVSAERVVTHGEPHPGNLVRVGGHLLVVDWDTVALAPRERDLWMLDTGGDHLARYAEAAGRAVDAAAIGLYRLRWRLDDVSLFVRQLRSQHRGTPDDEHALRALGVSLTSDARPWAPEAG